MTSERRTKVIFDTNVWISYLIGRQLGGLTKLLSNRKIEIIISKQLRTELIQVTQREKFRKYFKKDQVNDLLKLMNFIGTEYDIVDFSNICRDAKDDFLLGLIRASKADFLVTGDQDLLELNPFEGTEIIEPNQLINKIQTGNKQ